MRGFSRREFLRVGGAGVALGALPSFLRFPRGEGVALAQVSKGVLYDPGTLGYRTIDAAVSRLIPDDQDPGAGPARVVDYINRFIGAFENLGQNDDAFIYAGGPFSDRNPPVDPAYCGTTPVPGNGPQADDTLTATPLSRRQEISWRARILGTASLDGAGFAAEAAIIRANNLATGEGDASGDTPGLRQIYLDGIDELNTFANENFGSDYPDLDPLSQEMALNFFPNQDFVGLLFEHAVEGMYANPEYGGNQPPNPGPATGASGNNRPLGWSYIGFEGDRQPLGYTLFDPVTQEYCEIPGHPVSGPDLGPDRADLDQPVIDLLPDLVASMRLRR